MNIGGRVYAHMFLYQNQISNLAFGCHTLIKSLKFRILNLGNFRKFQNSCQGKPNHKNCIIIISSKLMHLPRIEPGSKPWFR